MTQCREAYARDYGVAWTLVRLLAMPHPQNTQAPGFVVTSEANAPIADLHGDFSRIQLHQ
jgi:hypothetical protein